MRKTFSTIPQGSCEWYLGLAGLSDCPSDCLAHRCMFRLIFGPGFDPLRGIRSLHHLMWYNSFSCRSHLIEKIRLFHLCADKIYGYNIGRIWIKEYTEKQSSSNKIQNTSTKPAPSMRCCRATLENNALTRRTFLSFPLKKSAYKCHSRNLIQDPPHNCSQWYFVSVFVL